MAVLRIQCPIRASRSRPDRWGEAIMHMGIKVLPPKSSEHLLEIIMRRYELKSTLMTSNRTTNIRFLQEADIPEPHLVKTD